MQYIVLISILHFMHGFVCTQNTEYTNCHMFFNRTLENYAKWQLTWLFSEQLGADDEFQEHLILFREKVKGKPTMEGRSRCVEQAQLTMPLALARLYAERILPSGSKVSTGVLSAMQLR